MNPGLWTLSALLLSFTVACSEGFNGPTETRDDSFVVSESPRVVVNVDNGRIIVNSGTDGPVSVQATLRKPDDLEYATTQAGNTLNVEAKDKRNGIFKLGDSPGADVVITAPPSTRVELSPNPPKDGLGDSP